MRIRTDLPLLLKNRDLSVKRLSLLTSIPRTYLGYIVNGQMVPTDEQLEEICRVLKVTSDMIYPNPDLRKVLMEV
ncbi:MAG: helix-turn-helix transcriptional regulator [Actinomycetota bacterium]|nr:helix-turn-helix transcriptional regulator [Actinomycetota bacterium]